MCTVRINEVKRESERGREEHLQCLRLQATCSSSTVCSGKRSVCACGRKQVRQTPGNFSAPQTAHSDAAQTAPIHDAFKRNEAVISAPTAAAVAWENKGTECWESLNGFGRVRSGFARMGCSVSFICCEEDFLQMPVYHHGEEKKKGSPKKVRRSCQKGGNARVANVRRHEWASNFSKRTDRACLRVCSGCFRCRLGLFICLRVCVVHKPDDFLYIGHQIRLIDLWFRLLKSTAGNIRFSPAISHPVRAGYIQCSLNEQETACSRASIQV